jgi:hypothetical protein
VKRENGEMMKGWKDTGKKKNVDMAWKRAVGSGNHPFFDKGGGN